MPLFEHSILNPIAFEEASFAAVEFTYLSSALAIAAVERGRHTIHGSIE